MLHCAALFLALLFGLRVQELCESQGGCPGLSILISLTVSVDAKQQWTVIQHWSQFVPNMSTNIRGHEALLHHHHVYSMAGLMMVLYKSDFCYNYNQLYCCTPVAVTVKGFNLSGASPGVSTQDA